MEIEYYVLRRSEDEEPTGMFRAIPARDGRRYYELLNAQHQWDQDQTLIDYFTGVPGAEWVSEEEARRILRHWGAEHALEELPPSL